MRRASPSPQHKRVNYVFGVAKFTASIGRFGRYLDVQAATGRRAGQHAGTLLSWIATKLNYRSSIKYITAYWLKKHGFTFDSLLVEPGNENIIYARGRYENRFNYAKRRRIRFFVEDDWVKALKLSYG